MTTHEAVIEQFHALVDGNGTKYQQVHEFLHSLTVLERRAVVQATGGIRRQKQLWKLAWEGAPLSLDDFVPEDSDPLRPVIYYGKNSLPVFTVFQKRFCRPATKNGRDLLYGYNQQNLGWFTGPGYFIVEATQSPHGSVGIDYREVPDERPGSWPAIRDNKSFPSSLIYGDNVDYMRRLADTVFIGRAVIDGKKATQNYFLLTRE